MTTNTEAKIVTPTGRIVFHKNLWEANAKGKYTAAIVFSEDQETHSQFVAIKNLIEAVAKEKWGGKIPKKLMRPIKFGEDGDYEDGEYDFLIGNYVMNAGTKFEVEVFSNEKDCDGNYETIFDEKEFKAGDYARMVVSAYAWEYEAKKGVSLNLCGVQKMGTGEAFYQRKSSQSFFAEEESDFVAPETSSEEETDSIDNQDF